jgi:hypothetical protein
VLCRSIVGGSEIDGNKKDYAARERKSQEDRCEEVCRCLPEGKIMANSE